MAYNWLWLLEAYPISIQYIPIYYLFITYLLSIYYLFIIYLLSIYYLFIIYLYLSIYIIDQAVAKQVGWSFVEKMMFFCGKMVCKYLI